MTKEELTRIKQAYYSGLKVQIWFNGYWENFDVRDYSMYSDPFSENRQYRIIGSDYADIAEKHIAELEKENVALEKQLFTLRNERNTFLAQNEQYEKDLIGINENLTKAKEIIKKFSEFVTNEVDYDPEHPQEHTDLWNELCEQVEQFLKEVE